MIDLQQWADLITGAGLGAAATCVVLVAVAALSMGRREEELDNAWRAGYEHGWRERAERVPTIWRRTERAEHGEEVGCE
jgi:hypothetical protein